MVSRARLEMSGRQPQDARGTPASQPRPIMPAASSPLGSGCSKAHVEMGGMRAAPEPNSGDESDDDAVLAMVLGDYDGALAKAPTGGSTGAQRGAPAALPHYMAPRGGVGPKRALYTTHPRPGPPELGDPEDLEIDPDL